MKFSTCMKLLTNTSLHLLLKCNCYCYSYWKLQICTSWDIARPRKAIPAGFAVHTHKNTVLGLWVANDFCRIKMTLQYPAKKNINKN